MAQEKLQAEIDTLKVRAAERRLARSAKNQELATSGVIFDVADVSMESLAEAITV